MKKTMMVFIFGIMLLIPSYSGAIIDDPQPTNIVLGVGIYEHRDDGYAGIINGSSYQSGDYFYLQSQIVLGEWLASFDDIISVKAAHWPQGRYDLLESRSAGRLDRGYPRLLERRRNACIRNIRCCA